jgi:DNA-damage-inducible protein J
MKKSALSRHRNASGAKTGKIQVLDGRHRDTSGGNTGKIQQKRSDTLNKNLSKPIPQFSPETTLGEMRKRTGKIGEESVRRAAAKLGKRIAKEKALPVGPLTPNAETIEAMKAARRGELVRVGSAEALLASLNADD